MEGYERDPAKTEIVPLLPLFENSFENHQKENNGDLASYNADLTCIV